MKRKGFYFDTSKPVMIPLYPQAYEGSPMLEVFELYTPHGESFKNPKKYILEDYTSLVFYKNNTQKEVLLSNGMIKNLVRYVNERIWIDRIDCYQFIHFIQEGNIDQSKYDFELVECESSKFAVGDLVGLSGRGLMHAMIFLGNGLYLSKLGHKGHVVVSRISTLREIYSASKLHKIVLKRKSVTNSTIGLTEVKKEVSKSWFESLYTRLFKQKVTL